MRIKLFLSIFTLGTSVGLCAPATLAGSSAQMTLTRNTQIPGETLKAGDYSITVLDQLADRMIVRVDSATGNHRALFLAVPWKAGDMGASAGPLPWPTGLNKTDALKGFHFPNGGVVEFVYPKLEAAGLAKANSTKVIAIDPESEGHAPKIKNLSTDEMHIVNLWMLSMTTTGVDGKTPAVLAQRMDAYGENHRKSYTEAANFPPDESPAAPTQIARLEQPTIGPSNVKPAVTRTPRRAPVVAQLPHTAGSMPLVWMIGFFSLAAAAVVRFGRMWLARRAVA